MKLINKSENSNSVTIIALSFLLFCGILVGSAASAYINADTANELTNSINSLKTSALNEQNYFTYLWSAFKYPIIIFAFSFSVIGVLAIPVITLCKGFFLGFSIGTIMKIFGSRGIAIALSYLGINSFILIPCIILISSFCLSTSYRQINMFSNKRRVITGSIFPKGYFIVCGIITLILCIESVLDFFLTPFITKLFI